VRELLRRLGPRAGISFGLILVVAAVVIVARLAGGDERPLPYRAGTDATPTVVATVGDDGAVAPTPSAYADDAAAREAASAFTTAWLHRSAPAAEWLDGLRPLATQRLITNLTGVDPMDVPAVQAVGEPVVLLRSDLYAQARVPIDAAAVLLGMVKQGDRWLVDTLDEDRG
jgi:hypothetical protein